MIDENMKEYRTLNPKCRFCIYFRTSQYKTIKPDYGVTYWIGEKYECKLKKESISYYKSAKHCKYYSVNEE